MSEFPRPIDRGNSGYGQPLCLGDENVIGDLFCAFSTIHILDWDGDGEREVVASDGTGNICAFKFADSMPDGTPIVDSGVRWGLLSRQPHRNENDKGLTGGVAAAADFDGDGKIEVILCPRSYSSKPTIFFSLNGGAPTSREAGASVSIKGADDTTARWGRGTAGVGEP